MSCCRLEQVLENGAKEAKKWKIERQKRRITRKEHQRLFAKFELEDFYGAKRIVESR